MLEIPAPLRALMQAHKLLSRSLGRHQHEMVLMPSSNATVHASTPETRVSELLPFSLLSRKPSRSQNTHAGSQILHGCFAILTVCATRVSIAGTVWEAGTVQAHKLLSRSLSRHQHEMVLLPSSNATVHASTAETRVSELPPFSLLSRKPSRSQSTHAGSQILHGCFAILTVCATRVSIAGTVWEAGTVQAHKLLSRSLSRHQHEMVLLPSSNATVHASTAETRVSELPPFLLTPTDADKNHISTHICI